MCSIGEGHLPPHAGPFQSSNRAGERGEVVARDMLLRIRFLADVFRHQQIPQQRGQGRDTSRALSGRRDIQQVRVDPIEARGGRGGDTFHALAFRQGFDAQILIRSFEVHRDRLFMLHSAQREPGLQRVRHRARAGEQGMGGHRRIEGVGLVPVVGIQCRHE